MLELLALLPVFHYLLLYHYSRLPRKFNVFRTYAVQYLDWLFVPFNLIISYAITFSWKLCLIILLPISLITILLHVSWTKRDDSHVSDHNGYTKEGIIHMIFMSVQGALGATVFLSSKISAWYTVELLLLLAYFIGYIYIVTRIKKKSIAHISEGALLIIGCVLILLRLLVWR